MAVVIKEVVGVVVIVEVPVDVFEVVCVLVCELVIVELDVVEGDEVKVEVAEDVIVDESVVVPVWV